MSSGTALAYVYDGTFDGLLTAVFCAYERREAPYVIALEDNLQCVFGQEVAFIETDSEKAARVERGLSRKAGEEAYQNVWTAFLSNDMQRETKIYRYIRLAMAQGRRVLGMAAHDDVLALNRILTRVRGETQHMLGFVRFSAMEGGIYYAKFSPDHNQIPLLMPHFADRFGSQPFLLHDARRSLVGVYDTREWYLTRTGTLHLPDLEADELAFRRMWKRFYDTIAIGERINPRCQAGHMPRRYWRDMPEHDARNDLAAADAPTTVHAAQPNEHGITSSDARESLCMPALRAKLAIGDKGDKT